MPNRLEFLTPVLEVANLSSTNAVRISSARTTKRFPSSRCASAIQIVRPSQSRTKSQPKLQPASGRLSAMISDVAPLFLLGTLSFALLRVHADLFVSDQCH